MFNKEKVKLGIAPIAWTNEMCIRDSSMDELCRIADNYSRELFADRKADIPPGVSGAVRHADVYKRQAYGCYIPRLILQPLVENSILHGIDMKGGNGRLVIRGRVDGTRLTLSVIDNGRGMSREQIQALLSSTAKKTNGLSAIGVPNVRERLEQMCIRDRYWH